MPTKKATSASRPSVLEIRLSGTVVGTITNLPNDQNLFVFDAAYIADMKKIHAADGAAFAKEAKAGSNPALKAFAAETHGIVEQHIGELDATGQ